MQFKDDTVSIEGLKPVTALAMLRVEPIIKKYTKPTHVGEAYVITSVNDGRHMSKSKHYEGHAFDVRIWWLTDQLGCTGAIAEKLGPDFDVVLEKDHIHIEYDPKEKT
jgi:hypothetical protein